MPDNSLQKFVTQVRSAWGPLTTELVMECQRHLTDLLKTPASESWLSELHQTAPANQELYRDPEHGFVLLAHTEHNGLYRPPHDHGRGWVIYAMQHGEIEMRTYAAVQDPSGPTRLVQRNSTTVRSGQVQVYLPGDIHDTRCRSESALLFRFTDRDLRVEDRVERRLTRYVDQNGVWTPAAR
ncbi:MAG: hypothetical protein Q7T84_08235 [Phenylobacterium sp.]|uniref:hypothetical protein n=1 Tax=Phenylobacterium sp. TaxID=1871053 RepID=UPI002718AE76|nr:hypothetical protein [Phenylobacterium sp.]MDO9431276.1 hypothetical protein [Phenylobacterium sp.]